MKKPLLLISVFLAGCESDLDGKYVSDSEGKVYQVEHRLGDLHLLRPVDKEQLKKQMAVIDSFKKQ